MAEKYCRLCTGETDRMVEIFSEQGVRWNIENIVATHFWFDVKLEDGYSNYICTTCWWKVETFHVFYMHIQSAQEVLEIRLANEIIQTVTDDAVASSKGDSGMLGSNDDCVATGLVVGNDAAPIKIEELNKKAVSSLPEIVSMAVKDEGSMECDQDVDVIDVNSEETNEQIDIELEHHGDIQITNEIPNTQRETSKSPAEPVTAKVKTRSKRNNPEALEQDEQIRNWCRMVCTKCPQQFYRFPDVKTHYRDEHKANGFIVCCNKKFFRRVRILEHISRHLNPDVFRCSMCQKNFADKPGLMNHMDGHAPPELRRFQCDKCPRNYAKKFQLDQHSKHRHVTEEEKKFICDECGKAFVSNSILHSHIRGVHENANTHMCEICAKTFKSKLFFEQHCLEHSAIKQPKVQCTLCGTWLKHAHSLRSHMSRHNESSSKHTCNLCGKVAPNKGALRSHQKYVHFSNKEYVCSVCDKAFKKSITLREHMTLHTGEVLYTCAYCPKTFNSSANMHSHKKKVHNEQWTQERKERAVLNAGKSDI